MDKARWLDCLSSRLRSQISLETAERAETWAVGLLGLASFGAALAGVGQFRSEQFVGAAKVLFLFLFYSLLIFGPHLFGFLRKGEKPMARLFKIRDFAGLTAVAMAVTFYSLILLSLSHQTALGAESLGASAFFTFVYWMNDLVAFVHALGCLLFLSSLFFFPKMLSKWAEHGSKFRYPLLGVHLTIFTLIFFGYAEIVPIGSPDFFEQLRVAGLFWISLGASLLLIGRFLAESSVPALSSLQLDVVSGRLERPEDILPRFKEAFLSRRLLAWTSRLSHLIAAEVEKIAHYSHEAIQLVSREIPSEIDLNQVEDRYRRAEALLRRLEKEQQRFLVSLWIFDLNEVARGKVEELRELFSRELRNMKLEIVSVRKKIDEKLISLKNRPLPTPSVPAAPVPTSASQPTSTHVSGGTPVSAKP